MYTQKITTLENVYDVIAASDRSPTAGGPEDNKAPTLPEGATFVFSHGFNRVSLEEAPGFALAENLMSSGHALLTALFKTRGLKWRQEEIR